MGNEIEDLMWRIVNAMHARPVREGEPCMCFEVRQLAALAEEQRCGRIHLPDPPGVVRRALKVAVVVLGTVVAGVGVGLGERLGRRA